MKLKIILLTFLILSSALFAQKKSKIKGNKLVTDVYMELGDFNAIEIGDNLNVNLTQSLANGYHIKADENLIPVVKFELLDSVLRIYTTAKITKNKKLEINLNFKDISQLVLKDDAEVKSLNKLDFRNLDFIALNNASYDLDIKADSSSFTLEKSTKGKLLLAGFESIMTLNENAYLKGTISLEFADILINKRSDMNLSGDIENLNLTATGSADIKAKNLKTSYTNLKSSNTSDIHVYVSKELVIYAKGKSSIYVYGNPEIKVDGLNDKSQIIKK
jgi:hypothetical protein